MVKGIETEQAARVIQLIKFIELILATEAFILVEVSMVLELKITAQALTLAKAAQLLRDGFFILYFIFRILSLVKPSATSATMTTAASSSSFTELSGTLTSFCTIAATHSEVEGIAIISTF